MTAFSLELQSCLLAIDEFDRAVRERAVTIEPKKWSRDSRRRRGLRRRPGVAREACDLDREERNPLAQQDRQDDHPESVERAELQEGLDDSWSAEQLHIARQTRLAQLLDEPRSAARRGDDARRGSVRREWAGGQNVDLLIRPWP